MPQKPKFRKGQQVEIEVGEGWIPCSITFIWKAVENDTLRRSFRYDVSGCTIEGLEWTAQRISELLIRRPDPRRGRRRVLRAHSVKAGQLT